MQCLQTQEVNLACVYSQTTFTFMCVGLEMSYIYPLASVPIVRKFQLCHIAISNVNQVTNSMLFNICKYSGTIRFYTMVSCTFICSCSRQKSTTARLVFSKDQS